MRSFFTFGDRVRVHEKMQRALLTSIAIPLLLTLPAVVSAEEPRTPAAGSQERRQIMDVLRVPCKRDLDQEVIFKVHRLNIVGDWALVFVTPLQPNGKRIDYRKTKYRQASEAGMFEAGGEALLRRRAGQWTLVKWRFGATDTEVGEWIEKYRIPKSILKDS